MRCFAVASVYALILLSGCSDPSESKQAVGMTAEQVRARVAADDPTDLVGLAGTDDALLVRAASIYDQQRRRANKENTKYVGAELRRVYTCVYNADQPVSTEWRQTVCGDLGVFK